MNIWHQLRTAKLDLQTLLTEPLWNLSTDYYFDRYVLGFFCRLLNLELTYE